MVEPDTGLITQTALTKTNGPESSAAEVGAALLDTDTTVPDRAAGADGDQVEVLGTRPTAAGRYWTGWTRRAESDDQAVGPTRPAVEGGFSIDDCLRRPGWNVDVSPRGDPSAHEGRRVRARLLALDPL